MTDYPSAQAHPFQYTCAECKAPWTRTHFDGCAKAQYPKAHCARPGHGVWAPLVDLVRLGDRCPTCLLEQQQRDDGIRHLRSVKSAPNPGLVEMLEDLIAMAKSGELVSISFAAEKPAGGIVTGRSQIVSVAVHVWALEQIKFRILREAEDSDD